MLLVAACGDGGGGAGTIPLEELKAKGLDAICGLEVRCGQSPDKTTCAGTYFTRLQLYADVSAGKIKYDGAAAAKCFELYKSASCNLSGGSLFQLEDMQACKETLTGTVALGESCVDPAECVSGACDQSACGGNTCCAGTCVAKVAVGGDCSVNGSTCVDGAFCKRDATAATETCTARVPAGQACANFEGCVSGTLCDMPSSTGGPGVCAVPPREGAACPSGICDALADVCDPATKLCVRRTAVGATCSQTAGACVGYARCDAATSKCVALVAPGGACVTRDDCISNLPCESGVCKSPADEPACTP